ncbi:hypothetical protein [Rhizobium lentis]|uniref:hypothetical protein n=1 Tax=Rhizobium lentis TaxID=1138194 RepID=UPI002180D8D2|nr:hypothetical protein [Rhizobium lentis]
MALSLHSEKGGGDPAASGGNAGLSTADWLSLAAAADGAAGKPAAPAAERVVRNGHAALAADWLSFAAAPTFAFMALLTAATGSADMICTTTPGAFPLTGMTPMYLLMSGFHLAPWLRLAGGWKGRRWWFRRRLHVSVPCSSQNGG